MESYIPIYGKITLLFAYLIAATGMLATAPSLEEAPFEVTIQDSRLEFQVTTQAQTVGDLLNEQGFIVKKSDGVFPGREGGLTPGMRVTIIRAIEVTFNDGGKTSLVFTQARRIGDFLVERNITLGGKDYISPPLEAEIVPETEIVITRITEEEIARDTPIAPGVTYQKNPDLSYGTTRLIQKGAPGEKEEVVRITYKNGAKIKERVLSSRITREPTPDRYEQGTKIVVGRIQEGIGSWYRFRGGLFAASTTIPKGKYARVTRTDTGAIVIVRINDYGPTIPGRVIDLDAVAFQKLAPLWKGTIPVKVEEIL